MKEVYVDVGCTYCLLLVLPVAIAEGEVDLVTVIATTIIIIVQGREVIREIDIVEEGQVMTINLWEAFRKEWKNISLVTMTVM